ncbi:putative pectinesterase 68-like protein [Corchorus olitorius]|uniref:Pectinesterase 68-like protein n=1 Tax=Corchorus olitorius TaxID=93759 RepID=A0A1R3G319_9ROSI|nr:putative pectinesterase 68-like protein [Corchorus olitorius]
MRTVFFGVYKCWGPAAAAVRGVSWARDWISLRPIHF